MGSSRIFIFSHLKCLQGSSMKTDAFINVEDQIGHCGIWCGSCLIGNGTLKVLTERYEKIIEKYGMEEWAFKNCSFEEFKKGLLSIQSETSCSGCLKGGGRPNCEIRNCASSRDMIFCTDCNDYKKCENSALIQKMREGAHNADLLVKGKRIDRQEFLKKGISDLKKMFPCCIQLCDFSEL